MNGLSWFIYLIQMVDQFRDFLVTIMVFSVVAAVVILIQWAVRTPDEAYRMEDLRKQIAAQSTGWLRTTVLAFLTCAFLLVFIPNRLTMLMIAGSEVGGKFIQSETVQGVIDPGLDLLKSWIRSETAKLNAPKKSNN